MIVSEEAVLTQTLALLPLPLIFGRIPKCFDTAVSTFLSSSGEPKTMLFISYFLSAIWLSHNQFCIIIKKAASLI